MGEPLNSRSQSSLVSLTRNFVDLMKSRKMGIIDIKYAAEILSVQKRRIYDITNVLEGIGLIGKVDQTSHVQWRGKESFLCQNYVNVVNELMSKRRELEDEEKELDRHIKYAKKNLKHILNDPKNKSYAYVTRDDFVKSFSDSSLITLNTSGNLKMTKKKRSLRIKLDSGRMIDARLVTEQGKCNNTNINNNNNEKWNSLINIKKNQNEQTETCNDEQTEKEITASVILRSFSSEHSQRSTDVKNFDNSPLISIDIPKEDYCFALQKGEGICELYDL